MVSSCRIFTYSPDNVYASSYYTACKKFDDIRNKVIEYEHSTDDRESPEYKAMMKEFRYWDSKIPETSIIAGEEEDRLAMAKKSATKPPGAGEKIDYMA